MIGLYWKERYTMVYKAGSILLNLKTKQIGLVFCKRWGDYSFPKGHLEDGESLANCAIRETQEETMRDNHLWINKEIAIISYTTPTGEDVIYHLFLAIDDGPTTSSIALEDREVLKWVSFDEVESILSYSNLKEVWKKVKSPIYEILENDGKLSPAILTDLGICPTCYNRENQECLYGDISRQLLFENADWECFLVSNPRATGHTIISTKKHYKDMMEIPDNLCQNIFVFAKKVMCVLKSVYHCESVYLCTMCDGPMNHFHLQLIPRYSFEKRGSKNFVKPRQVYREDFDKVEEIRKLLTN